LDILTVIFSIVEISSNLSAIDLVFLFITYLGSETFYIIIIPPIFWCINKKLGYRLLLISTLTAYICTILKNLYQTARPPKQLWKTEPVSYGFPSGHAQGSATFWLYLILKTKNKIIMVVGPTLIILISVSRVYLNVHYLDDIYGGIAFGFLVAVCFWVFEPEVTKIVRKWSFESKLLIGIITTSLFIFHGILYFNIDPRGVKLGAALMGIFVGIVLENRFLNFTLKISKAIKVQRVILGLLIAWLAHFGLLMVLPLNLPTVILTSWLGTFAVTFIAPWVFINVEKLQTQNTSISNKK